MIEGKVESVKQPGAMKMDVNFKFDSDMDEQEIKEFLALIHPAQSMLNRDLLEGKEVRTSGYPYSGSFAIGNNFRIARNPDPDGGPVICSNYTMFDDMALVGGETYKDRLIVAKIVKNWEAVKNFVEMLDSE